MNTKLAMRIALDVRAVKKFLVTAVFILLSPFVHSAGEIEPNNSPSTATAMTSGEAMLGSLYQDDLDYLSIFVPERRTLEISVSGFVDECMDILNPSRQVIGFDDLRHGTKYFQAKVAGTYYIRPRQCAQYLDDDQYSVTATVKTTTGYAEVEPNNTWPAATLVQLGTKTYGSLYYEDDDYFEIQVPSRGTLTIDIDGYVDEPFELLDAEFNLVASGDLRKGTKTIGTGGAGTYYLRAYQAARFHDYDTYAFTASFEPDSPSGDSGNVFQLSLEEPVNADTASGISNIRGWAVATQGIEMVELFVDGQYISEIPYGGQRFDVEGVFPGVPNSANSGFGQTFNYSQLGEGSHSITVRAYATDGSMKESSAVFQVAKFPAEFIPSGQDPDSSNSQASVDRGNGDIVIRNVVLSSGESYEVRLRWKSASQGYQIIQVRRQ